MIRLQAPDQAPAIPATGYKLRVTKDSTFLEHPSLSESMELQGGKFVLYTTKHGDCVYNSTGTGEDAKPEYCSTVAEDYRAANAAKPPGRTPTETDGEAPPTDGSALVTAGSTRLPGMRGTGGAGGGKGGVGVGGGGGVGGGRRGGWLHYMIFL